MQNQLQVQRLKPGRRGGAAGPSGLGLSLSLGFEGMARLKKITNDFNNLRENWEPYQSAVFMMMVNANLRNILGSDTETCLPMVMAQYRWKKVEDEVLVLAARGSGKTWLLMSALAAFIVNIPNFTVCCYAGTSNKTADFYNGIVDQIKVLQ